jgi:tRNA threonylcarbamoyladenosine biosynthesis protein TsaB
VKILSIDTTTQVCTAALLYGDEVTFREYKAPMQHTKLILPMVDELLVNAGCELADLDCLALTIGPGSFTGLRIGAGVIQGLAYGADLPVAMVSTLAVLAQGAYAQFGVRKVLPSLDARMQQVYWGAYQISEHGLAESVIKDALSNPDKVRVPEGNDWVGVGSGWQICGVTELVSRAYPDCYPCAKDILPLARGKFTQGDVVGATEVAPVYLREVVV